MYVSDSSRWPLKCFSPSLWVLFGHTMLARYASTINSASHRVPEPFRSTSSGDSGMIVASEKMKGCT